MELLVTRRERNKKYTQSPRKKLTRKLTETIPRSISVIQVKRRGRVGNRIPPKLKGSMWGTT